jgi:DNA repair protein RadD
VSPALRPYQQRGLDELRHAFRTGFRAPLYVGPTGSGKTVLFAHVARGIIDRGRKVWILVHRQELVTQTSRALDSLGIRLGELHNLIIPGKTPGREPVQICSVQTLTRRIEQGAVGDVDLIVIDEAHHATAGQWKRVLTARPHAKILGVTATPARTDGHGLGVDAGGVFDALVEGPSVADLIADGYLCRPVVYAPPSQLDLTGVRTRGGDYAQAELAKRMDRPTITGDAVAHYRRLCPGAPAIAFCASVSHAKHVAEQFRGAGFRADSLDGDMPDTQRRALIDALGNGRLHVLTSCEIVSEGTDIPAVAAAILLRPTQSVILYLQQVGRALRPIYGHAPDLSTREARLAAIARSTKPRALVLDHVGNTLRHGLPDEDREWGLEGVPKVSRKGQAEGPAVRVAQCPTCFVAHAPAPTCPNCGHAYQAEVAAPKQVAGELREVSEAEAEFLKRKRKAEIGRAQTREQLERLAKERGYNPKWVEFILRSRQGRARGERT